jgi:SAM-dependent methyltransferase
MLHARPERQEKRPPKNKVCMIAVAITAPDAPRRASCLGELFGEVEQYYSKKILTYGATPLGVDWSCRPTQEMRFVQLLKVCEFDAPMLINDIGCGYGALLGFLSKRHRNKTIDYLGVDISAPMIAHAQKRWKNRAGVLFEKTASGYRTADYSVASGIFNVKLSQSVATWERMIEQTLREMHAKSRRGFSVNFLAPNTAGVPLIQELYRVPPAIWFGYCEQTLDADVELIANYGMREYTLLVRKKSAASG